MDNAKFITAREQTLARVYEECERCSCSACEEYRRVCAPAYAENMKIRDAARAEYAKACASALSMKFAASSAALGCGALALMATCPKNRATGSMAQKSVGAPDSFMLLVSIV